MAIQRLRIRNFSGGLSDDDKFGPANSAQSMKAIDFRRSPAEAGLQRKMAKESGTVISSSPIDDMVRVASGDIYAIGTDLWKRAPGSNGAAGTWTVANSSAAGTDLDYSQDLDTLFIFDHTVIDTYGPVSGTPALSNGAFAAYTIVSQALTGNTYTLPTSISETATAKYSFTLTAEPITTIALDVNTKGTGTWTLTLHDSADNVMFTSAIGTGSVPASGAITFSASTDSITINGQSISNSKRLRIGHSYHLHLTVSTGTSKVTTGTASDLSTATLTIKAQRLIDNVYGHRTLKYGAKTLFCNERYVGEWEFLDVSANATSGFLPHRLVLPSDYIACGIANYSEYVCIAFAVNDSTDSLNLKPASGKLVFWDGTSDTFNFIVEVPQGVPESLHAHGGFLYFVANGILYRWAGGEPETVFQFPDVDGFDGGAADAPDTDAPYLAAPRIGMTSWRGLLLVAFPASTANTLVEYGIYSFGRQKSYLPEAVGKDYIMSTGTESVNFYTVGSPDTPYAGFTYLKAFGSNLLAAWKDVTANSLKYGVDFVNDASGYATSASWRSLWFDNNDPDIRKTPRTVKITFEPLPSGCTITPFVQYDRDGNDINGTAVSAAGAVDAIMNLDQSKGFYEACFGWTVSGNGTDDVLVTSITFKFDDNRENENATEESRATD